MPDIVPDPLARIARVAPVVFMAAMRRALAFAVCAVMAAWATPAVWAASPRPAASVAAPTGAADAGSAARDCAARGARYQLLADPAYTIMLDAAPEPGSASDLQLRLRTPSTEHVFSFAVSNGYGVTRLVPRRADDAARHGSGDGDGEDADPDAGMDDDEPAPAFYAFSADMSAWSDPPQAESAAPDWLFVPELGPMLWYNLLPGAGGGAGQIEVMPTGMFRRMGCGR